MSFDQDHVEKLLKLSKLNLKSNTVQAFINNFHSTIKIVDTVKEFTLNEEDSHLLYLKKHATPLESLREDISTNDPKVLDKLPYIHTNPQGERLFHTPKTIDKKVKK